MQIKSMADGKVVSVPTFKAGKRASRNPNVEDHSKITIKHGEYKVNYINVSNFDKYIEENDEVTKGQIICETNHLNDFKIEMFKGQERVNPDRYIEEDLLPKFSDTIDRRQWKENAVTYRKQDFNDKYFKEFKIGNSNIEVHESFIDILEEIKKNDFTSWHPDEVVILGNPNIYDTDRFNVNNITTNQEKIIQSNLGVLVTFDKDTNKGNSINKYIRELVDLLNMNGVMSIIIYNEGVYFDVGPKQLINNNDNIDEPFDKLPDGTNNT